MILQSPLNYTGGKYKLLPQILPLFPKDVELFVDLFCGGCNVGLNAQSRRVLYNDKNSRMIQLYRAFRETDRGETLQTVYRIIEDYQLSLVSRHGYGYYHCDSSRGLGPYNRDGFIRLRDDYNRMAGTDSFYRSCMLYVLIVYSFNNQIRFNRRGEFNLPVGKRDFNERMERKLVCFLEAIQRQSCRFTDEDFRDFDIRQLKRGDFVYVDPPYLISCATYNEQGGWSGADEEALLCFLDALHANGIRFALSNVLKSKGQQNDLLSAWLAGRGGRYTVHPLDFGYSNSNYHTRRDTGKSEEILVTNY